MNIKNYPQKQTIILEDNLYLGWESNPHSMQNRILNPARLPIPPPRHYFIWFLMLRNC